MKTMILYAFLTYMMPSGAIYYEFSALTDIVSFGVCLEKSQ